VFKIIIYLCLLTGGVHRRLMVVGSVAGPEARVYITQGQDPPGLEGLFSLQRFLRYPGSRVSIRSI